ncbi:hypothetical protein ACIRP7_40940 [Streptomyces sp. NPDC102270]|uniref:hypothetical protein n=1 Tax=Streptomyces sp. NPDC102270 TaxID=3366150 RepID=UPI003821C52A
MTCPLVGGMASDRDVTLGGGLLVYGVAAGVPVLLEIDRRTEDADDLVHKLHRYWEWDRLLAPDADRRRREAARPSARRRAVALGTRT